MFKGKKTLAVTTLCALPFLFTPIAYAAKIVDLNQSHPQVLQTLTAKTLGATAVTLTEFSRTKDFNQTTHVRFQETYMGYKILGADGVLHVNQAVDAEGLQSVIAKAAQENATMDGKLYADLNADLGSVPASVFHNTQSAKALQEVLRNSQAKTNPATITDKKVELIVYVDDQNKAHWAYQVSLVIEPSAAGVLPSKPIYILDAQTFTPYTEWDEINTLDATVKTGGGFGGNLKMGKVSYDGIKGNLARLAVTRDGATKTCTLQNLDVTVKHYGTGKISSFLCKAKDKQTHNNVYWSAELDAVNGGYSPDNDALFGGAVIKNMYKKWYKTEVLTQGGKPMMLNMVVHDRIDNAFWDGAKMTFGDGIRTFYPLTSLGVAAHEISHGFTQQHSNLRYSGQSGGMNEAYSDMAAQAAEQFAYGKGKNSWQIGPEIFKAPNQALRYMDQPSKDCKGKQPGNWCSIDTADQYRSGIDVHYSSGVYNHFFYALGTTKGWDARKAFNVMLTANTNYWTSSTDFVSGACGVLKAANALKYNLKAVKAAFTVVKIDTSKCQL